LNTNILKTPFLCIKTHGRHQKRLYFSFYFLILKSFVKNRQKKKFKSKRLEQIKKLSLKSILKGLEKEKVISKGFIHQKAKKRSHSLRRYIKKINLNEKENLKS